MPDTDTTTPAATVFNASDLTTPLADTATLAQIVARVNAIAAVAEAATSGELTAEQAQAVARLTAFFGL